MKLIIIKNCPHILFDTNSKLMDLKFKKKILFNSNSIQEFFSITITLYILINQILHTKNHHSNNLHPPSYYINFPLLPNHYFNHLNQIYYFLYHFYI